MIRRSLLTLSIVLLALLSTSFAPAVSAKPVTLKHVQHPFLTSGLAFQDWNGSQFGGFTYTDVIDHSAAFSDGYLAYYISELNATWTVNVGMEYTGATQGGVCGTGQGLQFFYEAVKSGVVKASHCYTPTQKQIGGLVQFGVSFFNTGGPGIFFWITNTADTSNQFCNPCSYNSGVKNQYSDEDLDIDMGNVAFSTSGNAMTAPVLYIASQYVDTNGAAHIQAAAGTQTSPNPPSMNEQIIPDATDGGGMFFGCMSETTSTLNKC